jgi:hypothetical protein
MNLVQILPFFTATYEMPAERVYRVFVASTDGFSAHKEPELIFRKLFKHERVSIDDVVASLSTSDIPGIVEAIVEILPAYGGWDGSIGSSEFSTLLYDLYSSAPSQYASIVRSVWH